MDSGFCNSSLGRRPRLLRPMSPSWMKARKPPTRARCEIGWNCTGPSRNALRAIARWIPWVSHSKTSMRSDASGPWTAGFASIRLDNLSANASFPNVKELKQVLRTTATRQFARSLIESMLTYSLGRGLVAYDYCTVEDIRQKLAADDYRIQNIIFGIVDSRAFQYRGVIQ